jgi:hypothetical protein
MKRGVYLYLDSGVVEELKRRGVNISREVNAYLASLLGKTPEPKRKMDFGNVVPGFKGMAHRVFDLLNVGQIWAEQGGNPPRDRTAWLSQETKRLLGEDLGHWWKTPERVIEVAVKCGFKKTEWLNWVREKVEIADLLEKEDIVERIVKAVWGSQAEEATEKAKVGPGG